jgi:hypothetical protein
MVQPKDESMAVGSGDVSERQPATEGRPNTDTVPSIPGVENSEGLICIECVACGFTVARTKSYVRGMRTMKCPHCLTNYVVKL